MSLLDRVREANVHDLRGFRPFRVAGLRVGFVKHAFAPTLARWPEVFRVRREAVTLAAALDAPQVSCERRTAAVAAVLEALRAEGEISGWRGEAYPVNRAWGEPPLLLMERAAVPLFGVCGYGVHMNGYVRAPQGLRMWVARRALSKPTGPGKLDQLVAGGQPAHLGLTENMIKECREEAGVPPSLAAAVRPVGAISYCLETDRGLRPDVIFNYDLELPPDFVPVNTDGEVESFHLWPVERVMEVVAAGDAFKFNCALVVIDFLIRHGCVPPDHPDYVALVAGLRARERALERDP